MPNFDIWDPAVRQQAANNVYDSIPVLEKLATGWKPDPFETPEEREKIAQEIYDSNLSFLKSVLVTPYYEGVIDAKRVQDAIDAAEANPPNPSTSLS